MLETIGTKTEQVVGYLFLKIRTLFFTLFTKLSYFLLNSPQAEFLTTHSQKAVQVNL